MLCELVIENYAVVERLRVRFHSGLNLLTGETGSGKSIVVDALGLLYGGRSSAEAVRSGADRARVSGIFEVPSTTGFQALIEEHGIEVDEGELLVEREIQAGGKSRAFVGSRPVTLGVLKELSVHLGDIHGQHEQQELFSPDNQLDMLDTFAQNGALREQVGAAYARWVAAKRELEELDLQEQERLRLADLWRFQKRELEDAGLKPSEDDELQTERTVLANVAKLQDGASAAFTALYESEDSAASRIRQARRRIDDLLRVDPSLQEASDLLKPAEIAMNEVGHALSHYLGKLEADPARLDSVESRMAAIEKLKRKYGGSVNDMIAFLADVTSRLTSVDTAEERRAALEKQVAHAAQTYEAEAAKLSASRRDSARKLEKAVETELAALAMGGSAFRVELTAGPWSAKGIDRSRFLISANKGEEPRPLEKVASGGELSRLALALKTCVTLRPKESKKTATPRTLVFDEVDAGIGGRTAESVARRLKKLSGANQVLCVTHLPQVAAYADHHYLVEKAESGGVSEDDWKEIDRLLHESWRSLGRAVR